jgi:predicted DNA-binding protein
MAEKEHTHRLGSLWVTPETGAALDRLSAESGKSINQIVREALARHLKRRA